MEHLTLEVKFATGDAGLVSGYASLFGRPADYVNDVIEPGAFTASLSAHDASGTMPLMLREHKGEPIGEWLEIEEDEIGLRVKGRLDLNTPGGREVYEQARAGRIDGLSIGYRAVKADRGQDGTRTLLEIELHEISLVRRPASSRARVLSVKSAPAGTTAAKGAASSKRTTMEKKETASGGNSGNESVAAISERVDGLAETVSAIDTRLTAVEEKVGSVKSVADRIEAKLNRPGATTETKAAPEKIEVKAFHAFLRRGIERMEADEVKTLTVANDPSAGYLAPPEFGTELFKNMVEFSPIRQYARVVQITGPEIRYPRRVSGTTAYWVDEIEDRTGSEPTFEQVTLTPWELATFTEVSNQLLEDNAYNLEQELRLDYAESFGRKESAAFVAGTGVKQPKGVLQAAGVAEIVSGKADGFAATDPADALIRMYHALPTAYAQRGAWLMNRNTMGLMRLWKDGQGRYLLNEPITEGAPMTLLGRPVIEAVDMPDVAANAFPVVFGDWSGYRIVDRIGLSILRDPYTRARNGITTFHARKRVGGDVTHPDKFVKLKVAA